MLLAMRGIFIMIKESRHQGDVTTIHLYMPNNKVPKYMTQKLIELKREINNYSFGVSIPHSQ